MRSKGLGNKHGQGEVGIRVPVRCCMECNINVECDCSNICDKWWHVTRLLFQKIS